MNRVIVLGLCLIVGCASQSQIDTLNTRIDDLETRITALPQPPPATEPTLVPTVPPIPELTPAPAPIPEPTTTPSPTPDLCAVLLEGLEQVIEDFRFADERAPASQRYYDEAFGHAETLYRLRFSLLEEGCTYPQSKIAKLNEELRNWDFSHLMCSGTPELFPALNECHTWFDTPPWKFREQAREQRSQYTDEEWEEFTQRLIEQLIEERSAEQ